MDETRRNFLGAAALGAVTIPFGSSAVAQTATESTAVDAAAAPG